jgi:drug/metabolite transporter (DMT)-like permease
LVPIHPWWIALRAVATVITGFSAFYAFSVLPLAQVYTILFASPLLITVLAIPVLGEKVRIRRWAAVIVGLIGVLVVLRPGSAELSIGHLAALMAAVGGSIASIIVRKVGSEERPVVMLLYPMTLNFVVMACALPFVYQPMPIEHLGMMGFIAVFAWIAGRMIISAYQAGEAAIIAPMQYSQIIWATIFGSLFFGEFIELTTAIGASIIIASGLYIVLRESRSGTSENTPVLRTRSRSETGIVPRISMLARVSGKTLPGQKKGRH